MASVCLASLSETDRALAALSQVTGAVCHVSWPDRRNDSQVRLVVERIAGLRPKTVILGGWSERYESLLRHFRQSGPFWAVYCTGSAGSMDISGEIETFVRVLADRRIGAMLYADANLAASAAAALKPSDVLPVCAVPVPKRPPRTRKGPAIVSSFCAPQEAPRANVLTTLLALADVRQKFVLYLNGLSRHAPYRRLLQLLQIPYRDFGRMRRDTYERTLAEVDIGLQLSGAYDEVVADHGWRGIPVITSATVPAMRQLTPAQRARMVAVAPDDPNALCEQIEYLLKSSTTRVRLGAAIRRQLVHDNLHNIRTAQEVLKALG